MARRDAGKRLIAKAVANSIAKKLGHLTGKAGAELLPPCERTGVAQQVCR